MVWAIAQIEEPHRTTERAMMMESATEWECHTLRASQCQRECHGHRASHECPRVPYRKSDPIPTSANRMYRTLGEPG